MSVKEGPLMLRSITLPLPLALSRACLWLAVCSFVPHIAFAQSAGDDAAVQVLVEKFFDLYQKRDLDGLMGLWSEKSPDFATSRQRFQQTFAASRIQLKNVSIRKADINKDGATVRAIAEVNAEDVKTGKTVNGFGVMNRTFQLVMEGGGWKVWKYSASEEGLAGDLLAAKTEDERKAMLAAQRELVTDELVRALLSEGRRREDRGEYSAALSAYEIAIKLAEQLHYQMSAAIALRSIGNIHYRQGNLAQALENYQGSLRIGRDTGDTRIIASALGSIGVVYKARGNYGQALKLFQESLKIFENRGEKRGIAINLHEIGFVHDLQGNYAQALEYYQASLRISREIDDKEGIAITLNNIGNIQHAQGKYDQALESYNNSLKISEEMGDKEGIAIRLNNIGEVVKDARGDYAQALEYYQKSLSIRQKIQDKRGIASALNNIGTTHRLQENYAQALQDYQSSLKISKEIGDRQRVAITLSNIGSAHFLQGNRQLAREYLANAITAVEELRGEVVGDEQQQQQFFQMMLSPYYQMIKLLLDEKKSLEAFGYAERVKARALLDTLENGRVQVIKAMTDSEKTEEQRLNAQVVLLNTQMYRENLRHEPDKAALSELQNRLSKARASYEAFQINLYAAHPELKVQRGQMNPIDLSETGKLITDAGAAVLEYVVMEDRTYVFILTKKQRPPAGADSAAGVPNVDVCTIDVKQRELAGRVERFRARLTQKDAEFSDFARQLYDLLIGPARSYLKNQTRLIIVPDGILWEVPFQTLKSSANRFLIEDYAVSYAPSLTVLREMMNLKRKHQSDSRALTALVAFGNPDVDPTTGASLRAIYPEVLADAKLLPLPQTEDMLKTLGRLYGRDRSRIYVGAQAREDRAKREASACRILQFATHGILDNTNPMYSRLVMSQSGVDEHEDGMLEAWEIMKLDLKAEMIVLSACETARGRVAGGEGMIGLAWAFFVAGCPTTVVSQWPVEVNSMNELMVAFHKKLKPGLEGRVGNVSKAGALRQAALKLMRNPRYRHPLYWAPFVVIGDGR
jgi:CHAT domain-containing protein/tetratricopeptide (TPR) repeat protein